MRPTTDTRTIFLLILFCCSSVLFKAQSDTNVSRMSALASDKKFSVAEHLCRQLMREEPDNTDYILYYARLKSWQQQFDSAIVFAKKVAMADSMNEEAIDILSNVYLWSGNCKESATWSSMALRQNGQKAKYLYRLSTAKSSCNDHQAALASAQQLILLEPANKAFQNLYQQEFDLTHPNQLTAKYLGVYFNPPKTPLNFAALEYLRKFKAVALIGRLTYGSSYSKNFHLELESYPVFSKRSYGFAGIGFSPNNGVFPTLRAGIEYYRMTTGHLELSGGYRFLLFDKDKVSMAHIQFAFFVKRWMLALKPLLVLQNKSSFLNGTATARVYSKNGRNYFNFIAGYGMAPYIQPMLNDFIRRLNTYRAGFETYQQIGRSLYLRPLFLYEFEEFSPSNYRNRFNFQIALTKFLK